MYGPAVGSAAGVCYVICGSVYLGSDSTEVVC